MTHNLNVFFQNAETARANRVREVETERHNRATEREEQRSNVAREVHNFFVLQESRRHSMAQEAQARAELSERRRSALETERESRRAHQANEMITRSHNLNQFMLGSRNASETHRANVAGEQLRAGELKSINTYRTGQLSLERLKSDRSHLMAGAQLEQNRLLESRRLDLIEQGNLINRTKVYGDLELRTAEYNLRKRRAVIDGINSSLNLLLRGGKQ